MPAARARQGGGPAPPGQALRLLLDAMLLVVVNKLFANLRLNGKAPAVLADNLTHELVC